ncbi:MarR family winged helix-turn-helix transcriptional regulator [Occallatibacter riparius]|uniref:MarR family transcriptional regulator n=1 Tax=Occallatibacter riparius TaxID=1002689 RepID=A0A9J7BTE3_9BACT|nr:MarR family transcriptional regulator [Occallatibacter riparius]UWZ84174.1 MarR family transcriptional regulator [Occallatibacter riparius]
MAGKRAKNGSEISAQAERMEKDLGAIRRALRRPLEAEVARGELTIPQSAVMQAVVQHDGISLKDLSREVSLAHSTVSGIVDRLEKRGMIERRTDAADGRVTRIHPTVIVRKFVREQIPALSRGPLQTALERAKAGEREGLVAAVARLRELLEEVGGQ